MLKVSTAVPCLSSLLLAVALSSVSNAQSAPQAAAVAPNQTSEVAPDPKAVSAKAHSILESGMKATGLTAEGWKPWHLKADYQIVPSGGPPGVAVPPVNGTLEEWWAGPNQWRRTYTTKVNARDTIWTEWSVTRARRFESNKGFEYATLDRRIASPLIDPLLQARNFKPEYEMDWKQAKAGVALDCVMAANPSRYAADPDSSFPKLCFDPGSRLRLIGTSDTAITFNKYQSFQDRAVAYKVDAMALGQKTASIDITLLEPLGADAEAMLKPDANAVPQPYTLTDLDPKPVPVYQVGASYPTEAFVNREYGIVTVPVLIQKDGRVKINGDATGPIRTQPAVDAVKTWRYAPYLVDGEPVEVSMDISYNFDGRPFAAQTGKPKR